MPYIDNATRELLENEDITPYAPGHLNYMITKLCVDFVTNNGACYSTYNDIIGALECCKQEFYRRLVAPHEDNAIARNGDVF